MMTLAQLRTFCAVARLNSFSRAAERLHLTQPAVSAQVGALEEVLKAKLFDRVGKKISLSDAGNVALKAAEEILGRVEQLQQDLSDVRALKAGHIAIGASQVVGSTSFRSCSPSFAARCRASRWTCASSPRGASWTC